MTDLSAATRTGYAADWALSPNGTPPTNSPLLADPDTVVLFLTENSRRRHLRAASHRHHVNRRYGYPSHRTLRGEAEATVAAGLPAVSEPAVAAERIAELMRQIPNTGWVAGLLDGRDPDAADRPLHTATSPAPGNAALTTACSR